MTHITVPDAVADVTYPVVALSAGPFTIPFPFTAKDDVKVAVGGVLLATSAWALGGTLITGGYQTGTCTLVTAVANTTVRIYRDVPASRPSDFASGPLPKDALNTALDRLTMHVQDLELALQRAFRVRDGQTLADVGARVPNAFLGTDVNGDPTFLTGVSSVAVSTAMTPVVQAVSLPAGRTAFGVNSSGLLYGLTLSNNTVDAVNDIDIAAGVAIDSTNARIMSLGAVLTKRLDAAWAVGSGNGGLDTGTIADTTYHVHLILRSDTGVVDALFSTSATAPVMPANYDFRRRIGSIMRAGGTIRAFLQDGDDFRLVQPVQDVSATNPGTAAVTRTLTAPSGIRVTSRVLVVGRNGSNNFFGLLSSLDVADVAPSSTSFNFQAAQVIAGGSIDHTTRVDVRTNTSAQIRSRQSASGASDVFTIITLGWIDQRDRFG